MRVEDNIRKLIVESHISGHSTKQISTFLNIKYSTIYAIIKVYQKEDRFDAKLKGGKRYKKINENHIHAIRSWIDEDCGLSLKAIKCRLQEEFSISICEKTVDRYISSFSYTLKRTSLIPEKRNDANCINARYDYAKKFFEILTSHNESHIFFVDEVGFNVSMRCKRGRSLVGTPAIQVVPGLRSRNISVCCAMTKDGIVSFKTQTSAFRVQTFSDFIDDLLTYIDGANIPNAVVVMDNVPFHKHRTIKEKFDSSHHILLYLAPYSPFLNPIENMFAKWKLLIRQSRPNNEQQLLELIQSSSCLISVDDCAGYFRNVFSFLPRCLEKKEILDGN